MDPVTGLPLSISTASVPRSHISSAKQTRILLWRSEVASALEAPLSPSSRSSTITTSATTVTTNHSAKRFSLGSPLSPPPPPMFSPPLGIQEASSPGGAQSPTLSRRQRFWRRLSRGFSSSSKNQLEFDPQYQQQFEQINIGDRSPVLNAARIAGFVEPEDILGDGDDQGALALGERSSEADARGGLKDKQDRLRRAARLLEESSRPQEMPNPL